MSEGYFIEHNGDTWQSVFPSAESSRSQLHTSVQDALDYMVKEIGIPRDQINITDAKQKALAAIEGLEIGDVLNFFYAKADARDKAIAEMVEASDELEIDGAIISEGDDNGAFVLAWTWVDFNGTAFDKEAEDGEDEDA
jgi:hypothetical protein